MKTSSRKIKVTANQSKRTFTIRVYAEGQSVVKYRTIQYSQSEFDSMENDTENDWRNFLANTDEYYSLR